MVRRTPGTWTWAPSTETWPSHQRCDARSRRSDTSGDRASATSRHRRTSTSKAAKTRPLISSATFSCSMVKPSTYTGPPIKPSIPVASATTDSKSKEAAVSSASPAPTRAPAKTRGRLIRFWRAEAAATPSAMPIPSANSTR